MITYASLSKEGNRSVNEDYIGFHEVDGEILFCLADGLGGHGRGAVASEMVVSKSIAAFAECKADDVLVNCFLSAQEGLITEQDKEGAKDEMKSTLTLLVIQNAVAYWGHVGDSRLYLFRKNKLFRRTLDHSVPQMLVATGEIRERDIRFHTDRNRLIRVMGMEWSSPKYDLSDRVDLCNGDAFLLCSDGFWELIDEKDMLKLLKKAVTADEWLAMMEKAVLKNGQGKNMDNYSAMTVLIKE